MDKTNITFQAGEDELTVKKKIPLWEAIKHISAITGVGVIIAAAFSSIANTWRAKSLKPYDPQIFAEIFSGKAAPILTSLVGITSFIKTVEDNKKIDSFTKRLEEEKAAKASTALAGRSV